MDWLKVDALKDLDPDVAKLLICVAGIVVVSLAAMGGKED